MQKFIYIFITLITLQNLQAEEVKEIAKPNTSLSKELTVNTQTVFLGGVRLGNEDINKNKALFVGVGLNWLTIGEASKISFFSPAFSIQSDGTFSPSISPVSIITKDGFNMRVETFPIKSNQTGGSFGIAIGKVFEY